MLTALVFVALLSSAFAVFFAVKYRFCSTRLAPILHIDQEAARIKLEVNELSLAYKKAKQVYDQLQHEVSLLEQLSEEMSFGLYKPQYSFESSAAYKEELERVYERKRLLITNDLAATYPTDWKVNNDMREGKRMIRKQVKIMLRAFNGECDSAVARVRWNNASRMIERINNSFAAINDLGVVVRVRISEEYLQLCLSELKLAHEYELKKQEEKEKAREDRDRMREEERAQKEFQRAEREAELEKAELGKSLALARQALQRASGDHLEAIQGEIDLLEKRMADAQAKQERAVSMAQLTKMGHVYIISNLGSFGENIFKIGMTRRLEPGDRIQELSGAAVPFGFDVHAMIFSEDAPALEAALHARFADHRLNLINPRKEYFRVPLDEITQFAEERELKVEIVRIPEARHFRESEAIRLKALQQGKPPEAIDSRFPDELFAHDEEG